MGKRKYQKPIVEIEFTPGYQQRFTRAILKIYEKREREAMERENELAIQTSPSARQAEGITY